jgi:YD repeat-containing protein
LELQLVAEGDRLRPKAAPGSAARVVQTTGSAPVVEVGEGATVFSWRLEGVVAGRSARVSVGGAGSASRVSYPEALPGGRSLQLQVQGDRVKEAVVLPEPAVALAFPSYRDVFTVPAGASARQGARGVEFVDARGALVAVFGGGHAFDSSRDAAGEPATSPVSTTLVGQTGRSVTVSVGVDPAWLADPARVFPATVDPDFYTNSSIDWGQDAYVDAAFPATAEGWYDAGALKTGTRAVNGGSYATETLVQFGLPAELTSQNNNVLWSELAMFNDYSFSCDRSDMPPVVVRSNASAWDARTVTWNSRPAVWDPWTAKKFAFGYSSACPGAWAGFDVQPQVQQWSRGRPNYGFRLWVESGATFGYKRFQPAELGWSAAPALRVRWENCSTIDGGPNGPKKVCGAIRDRWNALGGRNWALPTTDEIATPDGQGRYNHFANSSGVEDASIYWHPNVGAYAVQGAIRQLWATLGWETSLGYPVTNEGVTPDGAGRYNHFVKPGAVSVAADGYHNSIYWHPSYGARDVQGAIRAKWANLGWERGLGYPTTGESGTPDGKGRFNHFTVPGGASNSVYWTSGTGAQDVQGQIRAAWAGLGWERSWLGYPTAGQAPIAGGARSQFEGGNITWDDRAGATTVGAGVLSYPTQFQKVTQKRTQLKATAKLLAGGVSYDGVRFQWRPYSLTPSDGWADVDPSTLRLADESAVSGSWLPVADENGGKASTLYTWNATASIPADGLVQVRGCFRPVDGSPMRCTATTQVTVDRAGLTGANATSAVGPGAVSLLTGAYAVTARDAQVTAPHGGLAASRSFASNDPNRAGPLGPGWRLSLAVDEAGADYESLTDRTETVLVTRADGSQLPFVRRSSAAGDADSYVAEGEASTEGMTLTFKPAEPVGSYELANLDGDKVTFRRADGGAGHLNGGLFRVVKVDAVRGKVGSTDLGPATTTVSYTAAGNPRVLLAPTDDGGSCPDPTSIGQPAGCRALEFLYAGGGGSERLQQVRLWAHGAAAPAGGLVGGDTPVQPQTITLASYGYDTAGRLASVTDPRSGLQVGYGYRSDGRLSSITPAGGTASWALGYDGQPLPRLATATLDDQPGSGLPAQQSTVRYDLPRDGSTTALPTLTAGEVARWGQQVPPTDLTAVFDPATVPDATPTSEQWRGAQLYALDVNGRVVNTASFGGTVDQDTGADQAPAWRISTTEYDDQGRGNVVRSLTAGNRDRALAASTDPAAQAQQARLLDTVNVYSADGIDLLRSYGPARPVMNSAGTGRVSARSRTSTVYDTGSQAEVNTGHPTPGKSLHLPVRTSTDAVEISAGLPAGSTGTDPGLPGLDNPGQHAGVQHGERLAVRRASATRVDPGAVGSTPYYGRDWGTFVAGAVNIGYGRLQDLQGDGVCTRRHRVNTHAICPLGALAGRLCCVPWRNRHVPRRAGIPPSAPGSGHCRLSDCSWAPGRRNGARFVRGVAPKITGRWFERFGW